MSRYTPERIELLANNLINQLLDYGRNGLPACYANVDDYLCDMWPELPWNHQVKQSLDIMLAHEKMPEVKQLWQEKHNFDMEAELRRGYEEVE